MQVLIFDLKGSLAHFRRPDTTSTHASYPFITRTALRGLLAAILGFNDGWEGEAWTGLQLLGPPRSRVQQMSMLGKYYLESGGGANKSLNRPTAVELVVEPRYRVYFVGDRLEELADLIREGRSAYHTYLGSAFALTFPAFVNLTEGDYLIPEANEHLESVTVVPSHAVAALNLAAGAEYGRAGGMLHHYLGGRRFRGTINLIYEVSGRRRLLFSARGGELEPPVRFVRLVGGEVVTLW